MSGAPSVAPLQIDVASFDPALLEEARRIWGDRVRSEYQSIQIFTRLLSHRDFGKQLVASLLSHEPEGRLPHWRKFVRRLVMQHLERADAALKAAGEPRPTLEELNEPELARIGLTSSLRLGLLCYRTWETSLRARLESLGLWESS